MSFAAIGEFFSFLTESWEDAHTHTDKLHRAIMRGMFVLFVLVGPLTVLLAWVASRPPLSIAGTVVRFEWVRFTILALMFATSFSVIWVLSKIRNITMVAVAGWLIGYPAPGSAQDVSVASLKKYGDTFGFTVMVTCLFQLFLFHFPQVASNATGALGILGTSYALMITVIFCYARGMIEEGPWHRYVIGIIISVLVLDMFLGLPKSITIDTGTSNPVASQQVVELMQEMQQRDDMEQSRCLTEKVQPRIEQGEVFTAKEMATICPSRFGARVRFDMTSPSTWGAWAKQNPGYALVLLLLHIPVIWLIRKAFKKNDVATVTETTKKKDDKGADDGLFSGKNIQIAIGLFLIAAFIGIMAPDIVAPVQARGDRLAANIGERAAPLVDAAKAKAIGALGGMAGAIASAKTPPIATANASSGWSAKVTTPGHFYANRELAMMLDSSIAYLIADPAKAKDVPDGTIVARVFTPDADREYKLIQSRPCAERDGTVVCFGSWLKGPHKGTYELIPSERRIAFSSEQLPAFEMKIE